MPEISVIVPVYEVEKYLCECINSILAQTFVDFELILIDDGSLDSSGKICDEFAQKDNRIIVIHQENKGLSCARNTGIKTANGSFITFVDSDDLVANTYLEELYNNIVSNDCDIAICKELKFMNSNSLVVPSENSIRITTGRDAALSVYNGLYYVSIIACGKLFDIRLFNGVLFPEGMINEDSYTIPILLYEARKVVLVDAYLYYYRQRSTSIMGKAFSIKRYDGIRATEHCMEYFKSKNDMQLYELAEKERYLLMCCNLCEAKKAGIYSQVPKEYRVSEIKALIYLKRHLSYNQFTYRLSQIHPKLVLPYEYITKINKTLIKERNKKNA